MSLLNSIPEPKPGEGETATANPVGTDSLIGRIDATDSDRLTLTLAGNFLLRGPDGAPIWISEKKGRALLAMLGTARDLRRSREWLKSRLWGRSFDSQANSSLRQCLHALRKGLKPYEYALQSNNEHVWLERIDIDLEADGTRQLEFFEDAPALDEAGEDWLREERQAFAAQCEEAPEQAERVAMQTEVAISEMQRIDRPCVLIASPISFSDDMRAAAVADRLCNCLVSTMRLDEYVEVFDLRDVTENQLAGLSFESALHPPLLVEVRVSVLGNELEATIMARVPSTGRVLWTSTTSTDQEQGVGLSPQVMSEFVAGAVDSIEGVLGRRAAELQAVRDPRPTLYTTVHQLFGLSPDGISSSQRHLATLDAAQPSATVRSWRAFASVLTIGESQTGLPGKTTDQDEACAHSRLALELDPGNAIALAIAGHIESFVLRDFEQADMHLRDSRRLLPNLAFAWDATAMLALYTGDVAAGVEAAGIARRLGRYSPYRYYYDATAVIAATLDGRHADAVRLGERTLEKRPGFLPVMRHLCASYGHLGQRDKALSIYRRLRAHDPDYGTDAMQDPDYPLPSRLGRDVIEAGLNNIGLLTK